MITEIKASEYGLEEIKAREIKEVFTPMLDKMESLEKDYNEIIKLEMSKDTCIKAKDLRLQYVKVRTGTAKIHKELKAFYLQGGRFVDGVKNAQLMASQGIEDTLVKIENHYENIEKEKVAKLQEKREGELQKYNVDYAPSDLGEMESMVWDNYISGVKANHTTRIEAERKAEEEKQEQERIEELNNSRYHLLLKYHQWWEPELESTNLGELTESHFNNILESLKKGKKDWEADQRKIREENERLEAELKAKNKAEEKKKAEEEAQIQSNLNKDDKLKVLDLCADLKKLKTKFVFESTKNKKMYNEVGSLLDKIITHITI